MSAGLAVQVDRRPVIDAINALERKIAAAPGEMDAVRWTQAALVMSQLETMTQIELAALWISPTGAAHTKRHVWRVTKVYKDYAWRHPRPTFAEAYRMVKYQHQKSGHKKPSRAGLTVVKPDNQEWRLQRCRELADQGATAEQIAAAIGLAKGSVNAMARRHGFEICGRRAGHARRHHANRIIEQMVMDAENLTADVSLIAFHELDRNRLADWIAAFLQSEAQLLDFIRRLKKEAAK